jgi:V/A-type H+/Na+-transporting ATPase subunit E
MEVKLQELIESIKRDGVETAESKADEILKAAEEKAETIISKARHQAEKIESDARKAADMKEQGSISSIKQAGRDLLISLQKSITAIFDTLLKQRVDAKLKDDNLLADLIKAVLKADLLSGSDGAIEVPEKNLAAIKKLLLQDAAELLKKGYELKPVKGLSSGFMIEEKDGSGYYSITPEILAEMIGKFVNPDMKSLILDAAAAGEGA